MSERKGHWLNDQQKAALRAIPIHAPADTFSGGLPFIKRRTTRDLFRSLGFPREDVDLGELFEDRPEILYRISCLISDMAEDKFGYLSTNYSGVCSPISNWFMATYNPDNEDRGAVNSAAMGASAVMRVFETQERRGRFVWQGKGIIDRLGRSNPAAVESFLQNRGNSYQKRHLFIKVPGQDEILSFQVNLGQCVNKLTGFCVDEVSCIDGAVTMYKLLEKFG